MTSLKNSISLLGCFGWSIWEKNPASPRYVVGKGRSIILAFSDNHGYSLILFQNSTIGSF